MSAQCSFSEKDWRALAPHWYPVALDRDVRTAPLAVQLMDEKLVLWRTSDGTVREAYELVWTQILARSGAHFPEFFEWDSPDYV